MASTAQTNLKRQDVPHEQTWNRESVFDSWEALEREMYDITLMLPQLESFSGKLGHGTDILVEWLETYNQVRRRVYRLFSFVRMATAVDTTDGEARARHGQVSTLMSKFRAAAAFAEPEMLTLGEILLTWAAEDQRLNVYRHYFESLLRQKQHRQSVDVEKVLGKLDDILSIPGQTYELLVSRDMKFPAAVDSSGKTHTVAQAIVPPSGIQSADRILRRGAWESFCDQHRALENTLASNLITKVKSNVFLAEVRGYGSVLESQLAPQNMPIEVFHTVIETFKVHLPVWHRYWTAKQKALGVEQLHPYDIWVPLASNEPQLTYHQAVEWICDGLAPLGEEYVQTIRRGCMEERWVDYAQNEGRVQGAFASAVYGTHPFVFNTFDGTLKSMSILAHELGHAMHSYLMAAHQPEIYNGYFADGMSLAVAETASNFHQAMVRAYLMNTKADDKTFQLALIDEAMSNFRRYFFIMPTLARFEYEVYSRAERNQPLNAAILNEITRDLFAEGYGKTMVDDAERTATTWAQFQHFYLRPFYTFQYSVGMSAAHALAETILSQKDDAVQNYLAFLRAGWSLDAPDLFKLAGVDMTQPQPVEMTFGVLEKLVQRLESLVEA